MKKLGFGEKAGYGLGEIASNLIWQTVMFFLPFFYTDVFGISAAAVGTMFIIVRFFDGFNDPMMGTIADRTNSRWGKYRPYILFMAIPYGLGSILMFSTPSFSYAGKLVFAYGTYILMMIIYTAMMIPFSALSGVMTSDYLDRTSLNSYRFIGAFVGGLFIQVLAGNMVAKFGVDNESIVQAEIQDSILVLNEIEPGTAIVNLSAEDESGGSASQEIVVRVLRKGENPPEIVKPIQDTTLSSSIANITFPLEGVFKDEDNDQLKYKVKSTSSRVIKVKQSKCKDGYVRLEKKGVGSSTITIRANDGKGGEVKNDFIVRILEEGNSNPVVTSKPENLVYKENFDYLNPFKRKLGLFKSEEIDLSSVITDPDGDGLFFSATSENPDIASVSVVRSKLTLKKKAPGSTKITVQADDNKGGIITVDLNIDINSDGNTPPLLANKIDNQTLKEGFGVEKINISDVFVDKESSALSFSFSTLNNVKGYKITMSIFALMCVLLFLVTFVSTRERVKQVSQVKAKLKDDLGDLMKNTPWIILFIVSLITLIYVAIRSAVILYYFQYYVGDQSLAFGIIGFFSIGSITIILALPFTKWLTKIFDKRLLYVICMIFVGTSLVFYQFLGPDDIFWMFVLQILQSLGSAATMPLLWSMLADSADYSEWKTGRKAMGLAYSASTLAQKIGFGIGGALALWLLAFFGYQPNVAQSVTSLNGMKLMMGVIPAAGAFLCAVLIWFYSLDSKTMRKIEKELKERRGETDEKEAVTA